MARKLTTPVTPAGKALIEQNVQRIAIDLEKKIIDPAGDSTDPANYELRQTITYQIADIDESMAIAKVASSEVALADWPAQIVQAVRGLASFCDSDAESKGLVLPGTVTDDV